MRFRAFAIPTLVAGLVSVLPAAGGPLPRAPAGASSSPTSGSVPVSPALMPACPAPGVAHRSPSPLPGSRVAGVARLPRGADVIFLKNGSAIRADSVQVEGDRVRFTRSGAVVVVPLAVVDRIVRDEEVGGSLPSSPGAGPAVPGTPGTGAGREAPGPAAPPAAATGEGVAPGAAEADRPPAGLGVDDRPTPGGKSWDELPDDPQTPGYWRSRKRWILELIGRIEADLEPLPEYDFPARWILDGRILWTIRERERLEGRLERARAFLEAFEERARRAGVPPGWLRLR